MENFQVKCKEFTEMREWVKAGAVVGAETVKFLQEKSKV